MQTTIAVFLTALKPSFTRVERDTAPPASNPSLESIREGKYLGLTGPQRVRGRNGSGPQAPTGNHFSQPYLTVQHSQTNNLYINQMWDIKTHSFSGPVGNNFDETRQ